MKTKHVPLRTCIICGNKAAKRSLKRIVATPENVTQLDETGRLPGRGTYICGDGSCVGQGIKRGRLEHALRTSIREDNWRELIASLEAVGQTP